MTPPETGLPVLFGDLAILRSLRTERLTIHCQLFLEVHSQPFLTIGCHKKKITLNHGTGALGALGAKSSRESVPRPWTLLDFIVALSWTHMRLSSCFFQHFRNTYRSALSLAFS